MVAQNIYHTIAAKMKKKITINDYINVKKGLAQKNVQVSVHTCPTCSGLPSNISIMVGSRAGLLPIEQQIEFSNRGAPLGHKHRNISFNRPYTNYAYDRFILLYVQ